jgi:phosphoribosylanthranilate isomerase
MTKVKICGITNKEDAFWASSLGADFIGVNFYKNSVRKVSVSNAKEIVSSLPKFTTPVGVFVDEELDQLIKICKKVGISYVQLHGNETVEYCKGLKMKLPDVKIIKVIKIKPKCEDQQNIQEYINSIFEQVKQFSEVVDYIMFDTYIDTVVGGTGEMFDWNVLVEIKNLLQKENININFFVAGGLNADNVEEVVELLEPWCVDVCSGVERLPRRKDFEKMKTFIRKVKNV